MYSLGWRRSRSQTGRPKMEDMSGRATGSRIRLYNSGYIVYRKSHCGRVEVAKGVGGGEWSTTAQYGGSGNRFAAVHRISEARKGG
jgi:hypothetical protein